jgi:hypothetical protein
VIAVYGNVTMRWRSDTCCVVDGEDTFGE